MIDPIRLELIKNALVMVSDNMMVSVLRTSRSTLIKSNMDFSASILDGDGNMVAQGLALPAHLGATMPALQGCLDYFGDDIGPGDILANNDPYAGGSHLNDIFMFKPVYRDGKRVCFLGLILHHTDLGGRVAGGQAADSDEIFQEGLRIPPIKLYMGGELNETMWRLIEKNVRIPIQVLGDMRAQLSACTIAENQFLELVGRFGLETTRFYMGEVIDHTERLARAAIRKLPDGEFTFEDWIDDDGIDRDRSIRLFCKIIKHDDAIRVDWAGSSDQVKGAINCTLSFTKAVSYAAIRSVLDFDIPCNEGLFRAIDVTAPPGTVTNMVLPAACAARGLTGFRMGDCAFGALAMMLPGEVGAASDGGNSGLSVGGYDSARRPFIFVDFACGSWGGRPWADGVQGNSNMFANMASQSVELIESQNPLQILRYELIADRAGAGKYRGGVPYRRDYRFLEDEAVLQVRSDRKKIRPYGLYGGKPGKSSQNVMNPDGNAERLDSKLTMTLRKGDVFRHELPGGGGWGDPLERDPQKVLEDVRNEYVTPEGALNEYGVIIDLQALSVDKQATCDLRNSLREARGDTPMADISWSDV